MKYFMSTIDGRGQDLVLTNPESPAVPPSLEKKISEDWGFPQADARVCRPACFAGDHKLFVE